MGTRKHTKATAVERLASDSRAAREDARARAGSIDAIPTRRGLSTCATDTE